MEPNAKDPTKRFSDRVENYARYRPGYPDGVVHLLRAAIGLSADSVIADMGSGTGISSELFLRHGCTVVAVEPNPEMRQAAESRLGAYPRFRSVAGRAEATTLDGGSIDIIVAGQAFHWFDVRRAGEEFARIVRPPGWLVLLWNRRRVHGGPFPGSYEVLLQRYGTDYARVNHTRMDKSVFRLVFSRGRYRYRALRNEQVLDFEALKGRLLSSSYVPARGEPGHESMLEELSRIFRECQEDGRVRLEYDTEVYYGHVREEGT